VSEKVPRDFGGFQGEKKKFWEANEGSQKKNGISRHNTNSKEEAGKKNLSQDKAATPIECPARNRDDRKECGGGGGKVKREIRPTVQRIKKL